MGKVEQPYEYGPRGDQRPIWGLGSHLALLYLTSHEKQTSSQLQLQLLGTAQSKLFPSPNS